jgi:hypothetical protein
MNKLALIWIRSIVPPQELRNHTRIQQWISSAGGGDSACQMSDLTFVGPYMNYGLYTRIGAN